MITIKRLEFCISWSIGEIDPAKRRSRNEFWGQWTYVENVLDPTGEVLSHGAPNRPFLFRCNGATEVVLTSDASSRLKVKSSSLSDSSLSYLEG